MIDEEYTRQLLSEGEKFVKYRDEVVLVIGSSGSGKSAFVQYIATDLSKLKAPDSYTIVSTDEQIRSSPNFPSLFEYKGHNFYDCPGFDDTRDKPHALASGHFIKKLLDQAKKVKFILVVEHSSITDAHNVDFKRLLEHLSVLVKDFSKFSESTFLVATKVEQFVDCYKESVRHSRHKIINVISENLTEIKNNLQSGETSFHADQSNAVKLLTSLSNKKRLFLFWKPSSCRWRTEDVEAFMLSERVSIGHCILTAPYTSSSCPGEFPSAHQCTIKKLAARSTEIIIKQITDIKNDLLLRCDLQAVNSLRELQELGSRLASKIMVLERRESNMLNERHLDEIVRELTEGLSRTGVKESLKGLRVIERQIGVLRLLQAFKNNDIDIDPSKWLSEITGSLNVTPQLNTCETFLPYLYLELSKYEVLKNPQLNNVEHLSWSETVMDDNVANFIEKLTESIFTENQELPDADLIRGATLDQLNNILSLTVRQKVALQPVDSVITVKQNIIILSDVVEALSDAAYAGMNVKLFATDTIFIDCSLEKQSRNITLIAPTIKVIGKQKMLLKGLDNLCLDPLRSDFSPDLSDYGFRQIESNFLAITMSSLEELTLDYAPEKIKNHKDVDKPRSFEGRIDVLKHSFPTTYLPLPWHSGVARNPSSDRRRRSAGPQHSGVARNPSIPTTYLPLPWHDQNCLLLSHTQAMQNESMVSNPYKTNKDVIVVKTGDVSSFGNIGSFFTTSPGPQIVQHHANVYSGHSSIKREYEGFINDFHPPFLGPVKGPKRLKSCKVAPNSYGCLTIDGSKMALDVTNYKLYASRIGEDPFFQRSLSTFRNQVLGTDKLEPLYEPPALLNEMIIFEKESNSCGQGRRFVPLYVNLLQRVARCSLRLREDMKIHHLSKKSLQVLYTGILARVCSLKRSPQHTLFEESTQLTQRSMTHQENLKYKNYTEMLILERENYGNAVKERFGEVEALISPQFMVDIDILIDQARSWIKNSMELTHTWQHRYLVPLELEQYENSCNHVLMTSIVKNIALIIQLSVSYCKVLIYMIQESLAIDDSSEKVGEKAVNRVYLDDAMIALDGGEEEAKKSAIRRLVGLENLISNMKQKINDYILTFKDQKVLPADEPWQFKGFSNTLSNLLISVTHARFSLTKERNEAANHDTLIDVKSTLDKVEEAINQAIETEADDLEERHKSYKSVKNQNEKNKETKERYLFIELKKLKKIYTTFGDDYSDHSKFIRQIKTTTELNHVLVELHAYSRQVRQTLISLFKSMREEMTMIKSTLSEKRQVVLDVAKWDLRSHMRDLKRILEKLSSRFVKEEKFNPSITKAGDAMASMIVVYDSIYNYKNQAELAANISYMNDRGFGIENPCEELTPSIQYLHLVIQSNLDRFKPCVEPLKENPSPLLASTSSE